MDKYKKAGMFIEEYAVSNPPEILKTEEELSDRYKAFQKEFSPDRIATVPANQVSNAFMQIQDRMAAIDKSYTERVMVDPNLRDAIVKAAKIITITKLHSVDDYDDLNDKLAETIGSYYQSFLVYKYYSLIFPEIFSSCYQTEIQFHLIYSFGILPHEKLFVRGGQLAMITNQANMLSPIFNSISLGYFGNIKNYCKIDITDDQYDKFPMFKEKMIVSIGFKELGDLNNYVNQGQINIDLLRDNLTKIYYSSNPQLADVKAKEIANFWNASFDTVFVIMQSGILIALADCQGTYHFGNDNYFAHIKSVTWKSFLETNTYLPDSDEGANALCHMYQNRVNKLFLYQKYYNIFHPDAADKASAVSARLHPLNQILFGPSGAGKTFSTTEMAMAIIENRHVDFDVVRTERQQKAYRKKYDELVELSQISFITFHAGYTYENFIQSINPDMSIENGVFKRISDRAYRSKDKNYVLIIDEINRTSISNVFGEVISLIDEDKRKGTPNELSATLPLGDTFSVPINLYIIATINSVDKSLPAIDPALRRRFNFIEILPNENLVQDDVLKTVFINLNETLFNIFNSSDFLIGHSYFMNKKEKDLVSIINLNVLPLLYEYFQDDPEKIKQIIEFSVGDYLTIVDSRFGRIRVSPKS